MRLATQSIPPHDAANQIPTAEMMTPIFETSRVPQPFGRAHPTLRPCLRTLGWITFVSLILVAIAAEDEVELLSGTRFLGQIVERTDQSVKIEVRLENRTLIRSFPIDRLRSITWHGQRELLTPASDQTVPPTAPTRPSNPGSSDLLQRAPEAVEALINELGQTPPEWFHSAPLEYPATLDLTWPEPTPLVWNYTRNVEHYVWDIINSNPSRYRGGVRFMHHLLAVNQKNEPTRDRVMNELGRMYFEFFGDFARAAFWWRQGKVAASPRFSESAHAARLAECYFRLGNRSMAVALLERLPLTPGVIKAWGDLKETEQALALSREGLRRGLPPSQMNLLAGDACRAARQFTRATEFYRRVLESAAPSSATEEFKRDQERARATLEVIRLFDTLDVRRIPDGTYPGRSLGYAGAVEVEAVVKDQRLETIKVVQNPDRQYYHAVEDTIERIITRQTVQGVDAISGATFTSEAVIRASAKALAEAMTTKAHRGDLK